MSLLYVECLIISFGVTIAEKWCFIIWLKQFLLPFDADLSQKVHWWQPSQYFEKVVFFFLSLCLYFYCQEITVQVCMLFLYKYVCFFYLSFSFDVHGITLNTILAFIYPVNVYIRSRLTWHSFEGHGPYIKLSMAFVTFLFVLKCLFEWNKICFN